MSVLCLRTLPLLIGSMRRVDVRQLAPGTVLAAAVTSASGVVLVQAGSELTDPLIARLLQLGVESVLVVADEPVDPEVLARHARAVEALFAGHEADPWMMALKHIVLGQASAGKAGGGHA